MEGEIKNQKPKNGRKPRKRVKLDSSESQLQEKKQSIHDHQSPSPSEDSDSSSGWSSEVIEPAIKTMAFRPKRGTRMKELIKGKHRKDQFWDKYQNYFGGDINKPEDSQDEEDYEASSSGRDQFDSDFDLTDSYVGKRGRKKGTKIKKRKRAQPKPSESKPEGPPPPKGRRGRKRKVVAEPLPQQKSEILLKEEKVQLPQEIQQIHHGNNTTLETSKQAKPDASASPKMIPEQPNAFQRPSNGHSRSRKNSQVLNCTPRSARLQPQVCPSIALQPRELQ